MGSNTIPICLHIGMEIDVDDAREWCRYNLGDEYYADMTDEDCVSAYAAGEYSQGLGCEVDFL